MTKRTTIVLAILNAALAAFIFFVDRGRLGTNELAGRSSQVLTRFVRDRVSRLELVRGDEPAMVMVRDRDDEDELGVWRLEAPIAGPVDEDRVDGVLSGLEWIEVVRRVGAVSAEDRASFGLDEPRYVVRYRVGEENVELRVGVEAPSGGGVYAGVEGEDRVFVVGQTLVEGIDHDVDWFRDRRLFRDYARLSVSAIDVEAEGLAPVSFERGADRAWRVTRPTHGLANRGLVDAITRGLGELNAVRFVAEGADESTGIDSPYRELRMRSAGSGGAEDSLGPRLRVGAACGDHEGERYARAGDDGPVVCVNVGDLSWLELDRDQLREMRLLPFPNEAIDRVALGGGVVIARAGTSWTVTTRSSEATPADDDAVTAWLDELRAARALGFDDDAFDGSATAHGLESPRAVVTFTRSESERPFEIALGGAADEGTWVRRADEAAAVSFPSSVAASLTPPALRFRRRALVDEEVGDAVRVEIVRDGVTEVARRGDGGTWTLESPLEVDADRLAVREVARQLAGLRAARFVAAEAGPAHGLERPAARVTVRFAPRAAGEGSSGQDADPAPRNIELELGAPTVAGAYARLSDDPAVFELTRDVVESLSRPLVSLDLLVVDAPTITSVAIDGEHVEHLTRAPGPEGAWTTADGEPASVERVRALTDRLGTLRASAVDGYRAPPSAPALRVTVGRVSGPDQVIGVGRAEGDSRLVWLEGLDLVYRVRAELLSVFTGAPAPAP